MRPNHSLLLQLALAGSLALSAQAQLYWKTSAANAWNGAFWATSPAGPYTTSYTSGSAVVFEDNGGVGLTITGATTNFSSIVANENVTVTASGTLGTGGTVASITVAAGKTFDLAGQNISTTAGTGLIKNGDGILSLANGNSYTGGFTLNAGTVRVGGVNALGNGGALVLNGGILSSNSASARDLSGKFAGGITLGGNITIGDVTNTGNITFSNNVNLGSTSRTINTVGGTAIFNGVITGTGTAGINKTGSGSLEFGTSANNTFAGNSAIRAGNVFVRHANAFGTTGTVTLGDIAGSTSATLRLTGITFSRPIILETGTTGTLIINNLGAGAQPIYQGGISGTNNLTIQSVIGGSGTSITTFNTGDINHSGALTLNNTGAGTSATAIGTINIDSGISSNVTSVTVSDTSTGTKGLQRVVLGGTGNTYTGDTTVNTGARLELSSSEVIPNGTGKGNAIINGTLDLRGGSETVNGLSGSGSITRSTAGSSTLTVGGNNATSSFSGTIANTSGTVGLTKTGTGTLTLSAANTYSGDTLVETGGKLTLETTNQVIPSGTGKGNVTINGALDLRITAQTFNGLSGSGTITRGTTGTSTLTAGGNNAAGSFSGLIENGSGTVALTKTGTGTLTLSTANTYSGTTTIGNGAGILAISNGSALGTGTVAITKQGTATGHLELSNNISVANNITFNSATAFGGGGSAQIRNASGDNTLTGTLTLTAAGGNGINLESAAGLLTVTNTITSTVTDNTRQLGISGTGNGVISGAIQNTGSNAFSLVKSGTGTWTLSETTKTYTGATDVTAGTLRVDTTLSGTSGINVSSTAKLQGTGTVNTSALVTVNGTLAPGNSAGTLTVGSLALTSTAVFDYEFGLSGSDRMDVAGTLSLDGSTLSLTDLASGTLQLGDSLTLIAYNGIWNTTTFNGLADGSSFTDAGYEWQIDYNHSTPGTLNGGSGSSYVTLTVVPEPTSVLLGALGLLAILRRRRS